MLSGPGLKPVHGTILQIILEKTGKTRLNRASLRDVPVADLRKICEEIGVEHENLTKPEIICFLLDAGELNVGGGFGAAGAVVKTEPVEDSAAPDDDGAHHSAAGFSGRGSGRGLTRKSLKPAKPTRANPRRGSLKTEDLHRPRDATDTSKHTQPRKGSDASRPCSLDQNMPIAHQSEVCVNAGADDPDIPSGDANFHQHPVEDMVIPSDEVEMENAGDTAGDDRGADEQTPTVYAEEDDDDQAAFQPLDLEVTDRFEEQSAQADVHVQQHASPAVDCAAAQHHDDSNVCGTPAGGQDEIMHDPLHAPLYGHEHFASCAGSAVDFNRNAAASDLTQNSSEDYTDDPEQSVGLETSLADDEADIVADRQNPGQMRTEELEDNQINDACGQPAAVISVSTKLHVSDGSSMQQARAKGDTHRSTGAAGKRIKAPIVWKTKNDNSWGGAEGLRRGMFDHVLRESPSALEEAHGVPLTVAWEFILSHAHRNPYARNTLLLSQIDCVSCATSSCCASRSACMLPCSHLHQPVRMPHHADDPVEPYSGPRLIVTLVKPSYAISRNKPGPGLPRRTVAARQPPGIFSVSRGPGVTPAECRGPLEMSAHSTCCLTRDWIRCLHLTIFAAC